jgi:hypothetical protein
LLHGQIISRMFRNPADCSVTYCRHNPYPEISEEKVSLPVKPAETQAQMQSGSCAVLGDVFLEGSPIVVSVAHLLRQASCVRATSSPGSPGSRSGRSLR